MRRTHLRALAGATVAAAALGLAGAWQAGAQSEPALKLRVTSFEILRQDTQDSEPQHAFVLRQGERYQFRIHYLVSGAARIRTGHTYAFENATTGARVDVTSSTFDPDKSGSFNEYSTRVIPADWEPGVYRVVWTMRASAVRRTSASEEGETSFLVAGPLGP